MEEKVVKVIPERRSAVCKKARDVKRVCAYARVSTLMEDQAGSFNSQVSYYKKYIEAHSDWSFAGIYCDEGISGVSTKQRDGFNKMINDATSGCFDLIITKSISRFARNTVDALQAIRLLKSHGVEVYFEKENIRTLDSKVEVMLSILSCLAQDESRTISENTQWGIKKRFERGFVRFHTSNMLGYYLDENKNICINKSEADVVRLIYKLFLKGLGYGAIARHLMEKNILSPSGKNKWYAHSVKSILQNERYTGDAICQKYYTVDFLQKVRKKNTGAVKKYYVKNNHEAIIDRAMFKAVQKMMRGR